MAGRVRDLIDELIQLRTGGNTSRQHFVRALLMVKGIDPDGWDRSSDDEPQTIDVLEGMIRDFGGREAR